jgi:hypothetical protein
MTNTEIERHMRGETIESAPKAGLKCDPNDDFDPEKEGFKTCMSTKKEEPGDGDSGSL